MCIRDSVCGSQCDARELSDEVCLLVCHRCATQHRERISTVGRLNLSDSVDGSIQCFVPRRVAKTVMSAEHRRQQPVRVLVLQIALNAFGTEHAADYRKLFPRFESDNLVLVDL